MLNIKLAPEDSQSMAQDGYSILRSLQNKSLAGWRGLNLQHQIGWKMPSVF